MIRQYLIRFAQWLLAKCEHTQLLGIKVDGDSLVIDFKNHQLADGKWHHFAMTADFWSKTVDGKEKSIADIAIWMDGESRLRYMLNEAREKFIKEEKA